MLLEPVDLVEQRDQPTIVGFFETGLRSSILPDEVACAFNLF